jgi:hypothetical protein
VDREVLEVGIVEFD